MNKKNKLLSFSGNPTQYHSPLFREIHANSEFDLEVLFGDEIGAKPFYSEEFASEIEWDVPVLDGYKYKFFKNFSDPSKKGFFSRNNPGIIPYVVRSDAAYVLIHGYDTLSSWYVFFASLISRKKIIWRGEAVDPISYSFKTKIKSSIKSLILPIYFKCCHMVLYSCKLNKKYLKKYVGKNVKLISFPCSVDNNFFEKNKIRTKDEKDFLKKSLNIPEEHIVVASCSRLTKRKRTMHIIESISKMDSKNVTLLVIGDGPERNNLENKAKELDVNFVCVGFVGQKEVAKLLSISNIFTLISEYDASPKALNEAMNFPLGMIVSEGVGTCIDLIEHNKNGFILNNKNINELTSHLNFFINNNDELIKMGKYNSLIIENYSYKAGIKNILDNINGNKKT